MNCKLDLHCSEKAAAASALASGVIVHAFALVNSIHNYDDILQQPTGYGAGITLGRWLLTVLGDIFTDILGMGYNLPAVNGLAFIVLIALSAALLVNILQIRHRRSAVLIGCLMATFPTVCAAMAFRYVAPYFGLSLFLSVLGAWWAGRKKIGLPLSALCIGCSMGIYQAYVPVSIGIFLLLLMKDALEEDAALSKLIRKGLFYCGCLLLGVAVYFVGLRTCLAVYPDAFLDTYQGVSTMGQITPSRLPSLIWKAWSNGVFFPLKNHYNLTPSKALRITWLVLYFVIGCLSLFVLFTRKVRRLPGLFFCLIALLFPLGVNFIEIMCPDGIVYTLMVYALVLFACVPLLLLELVPEDQQMEQRRFSALLALLLSIIVLYNGYYSNVNYTALYFSNRQVENFAAGLVGRMQAAEGYTPDKRWVFTGTVQDTRFYDIWHNAPMYGGLIGCSANGLLRSTYSYLNWFSAYVGVETPIATEEERKRIESDPRFQQMPYYPSEGSVQIIDDYVVVKFPETE